MPERRNRQANGEAELLHTLRTAAQQIWMVGLSTLARTQEEGGKVLGALKNEGKRGGRSARVSAGITDQAGRAAAQAAQGASATIDRLEHLFEAGICRTLERLGVPTAKDMRAINERLDALEGRGAAARKPAARPRAAAAPKKRAAARPQAKATAKTAAKRVAKKRSPARSRAPAS